MEAINNPKPQETFSFDGFIGGGNTSRNTTDVGYIKLETGELKFSEQQVNRLGLKASTIKPKVGIGKNRQGIVFMLVSDSKGTQISKGCNAINPLWGAFAKAFFPSETKYLGFRLLEDIPAIEGELAYKLEIVQLSTELYSTLENGVKAAAERNKKMAANGTSLGKKKKAPVEAPKVATPNASASKAEVKPATKTANSIL